MLARGALCRLAAEVPKQATHDLPKLASLVQAARTGYPLPIRTLAHVSHVSQPQVRAYATTKAATKPTETVKKAVKAKAAAGKSVKKTTTAKKAAPKKAAPKKAKKKAAPKKPVVKKAKKGITPEQKLKNDLAKLKVLALREPVPKRSLTALNVYIAEQMEGSKGAASRIAAEGFKTITPAERERLNHLAAERNVARAAEYKAWIESHTPDQIRIANNARAQLRKKLPTPKGRRSYPAHTAPLVDERQVKRPRNAWVSFFSERTGSSDFNGIALTEKAKLIAGEWKALAANEKQGYEDRAAADRQRYAREASASPSSSN